jgi:Caspase domain.
MKRFLFIILLLASISMTAQNRYALLIGIGDYPQDSGWNKIHGDNDVSIIKTLLLQQGFVEDNIMVLKNAEATKSGILSAMDQLRGKAQTGDVVYIQFSGHGQQVTDLNGDEEDHFDEAWIPYDAKKKYVAGEYEGQNHILDDELNKYLNGLRSKVGIRGKIVLVADACHSGSGSRGLGDDEEVYVRGTDEKFIIPGGGANIVRKEEPVYWLYVGACKPYQTNYEYKTADGVFYGSLSYVIANGNSNLVTSDYRDVINQWRKALVEITRYPQDMDDEGRPSRRSDMMF